MPYAPGNSNNSGQIFAQGLLGAAQTLGQGFREQERKAEQDKVWTAQSKATESLLKSYLPKDQSDSVLAIDPKETPEARHARLTGTIENYVIQNKLQEQKRAQAQQDKDQQALSAAISQFMPQGVGQQLQGGANFSNLRDPSAQSQFDPTRFMSTYFQKGGSPGSLDKVDQALKLFNPPRTAGQKAVDPASFRATDPRTGRPIMRTVDQISGNQLAEGPIQEPPDVPNQLVVKQYEDLSEERKTKVVPAMQAAKAFEQIDEIVSRGNLVSGTTANAELGIRKLVTALGGKPDPKVADTEVIRSQFSVPIFSMIKNLGSGSAISNSDREFAAQAAGGDIKLDDATIKRLAKIGKKAAEETVDAYNERLDNTFSEDTSNEQYKQARNSLKVHKVPKVSLPSGWSISP